MSKKKRKKGKLASTARAKANPNLKNMPRKFSSLEKYLRELRLAKRPVMTAQDMANALGNSPQFVCNYESLKAPFPTSLFNDAAHTLGIKVEEMLKRRKKDMADELEWRVKHSPPAKPKKVDL